MAADDGGFDDLEESLLLDPPDPVDLLIAHTEDVTAEKPRPLDFVRAKMKDLKGENRRLRERVADLEQTLSIVQTAQEWTMGKGMTPEQAERMREIKALLEQAKKAREDLHTFSGSSKAAVYEKLRKSQNALKRTQDEKREMRERLGQAFHHARVIQEEHRRQVELHERERQSWQERIATVKERHRRELRRLQGDAAAHESDRHDRLSQFGEQVMSELSSLQQHLRGVKQETVDAVAVDDDDEAAAASGETFAPDFAGDAYGDDGFDDGGGGFGDGGDAGEY